ncbi:MAG: bifunctional riboflavin kinase/FAD synthetase [Candidatus Omnitrophica bacterium]|nr:bifunctional riboflavin kinase/FAD synthetase [Candidatus Omnitrophota bacterium]
MQVFYDPEKVRLFSRPIVAIGMFDGVHIGHQQIIKQVVKKAKEDKATSVVLTFWPHPRKKQNILSLKKRLELFRQLGIEVTVVIRFDERFKKLTAKEFVEKILYKKMATSQVYVGENFRFGYKMHANIQTLKNLANPLGIQVKIVKLHKYKGKPVSSSLIRKLIITGKIKTANRLLGRTFTISGTVVHAKGLARKWKIPTANISTQQECLPPYGVYASRVFIKDKHYLGACYIGRQPNFIQNTSFEKEKKITIEVHIFDFSKQIYGKQIEVECVKKIRNPKSFRNEESLIRQIKEDIKKIKKYFSHLSATRYSLIG